MVKKNGTRPKHIPQRTCVGCRLVLPKRTLVRIVRSSEGIMVDLTGKAAGRGAYLHNRRSCWEKGMNGALSHALRADLTDQDTERLKTFANTLPEDDLEETQMVSKQR